MLGAEQRVGALVVRIPSRKAELVLFVQVAAKNVRTVCPWYVGMTSLVKIEIKTKEERKDFALVCFIEWSSGQVLYKTPPFSPSENRARRNYVRNYSFTALPNSGRRKIEWASHLKLPLDYRLGKVLKSSEVTTCLTL